MTDRRRYIRASNEYCNWIEWEAAGRPERRSVSRRAAGFVIDSMCAAVAGASIGVAISIIYLGFAS